MTVPLIALCASSALAAERIAVPIEPAPPEGETAGAADSWSTRLLAPLKPLGVESWGDIVRFEPWTGSVGFTFDDQEQRSKSSGTPTDHFSTRLWSETFVIRNDGVTIIDPALMSGSMGVGFTLEQERETALGLHRSEHNTLATYGLDMSVLPDSAYVTNIFANRSQNTYVQPSGSTTHTELANRGIAFHLHDNSILRNREILPYFTANAQIIEQTDKTTTTNGGQSFVQNDKRDQFQIDFQNGTETSDLSFQYQFTHFDNFAYAPGSYNGQSLNTLYSIDFGPTHNWRSDTRFNWYQRNGQQPESDLSNIDFNEFLTIDHNQDLSSYYNYQFNRQDTRFGKVTSHTGTAQVQQQVYGNLAMTYGAIGTHSSLQNGTISSGGGNVSGNYSHTLPWSGHIYASGAIGYFVTDSQVPGGVAQIVDEAYRVPDSIGAGVRIQLNQRNIDATSIVVIVVKTGGTRVPAVLNVDYTIEVEGDRTYIVPLPTSAVMQPGDLLNVTYTYLVAGASKFSTTSRSVSVNAEWSWIGFSVSRDAQDQTPITGDSTLLTDEHRDSGSAWVRGEWNAWTARLTAAMIHYDSTRLVYHERRLDQYVTYQPYLNLQLTLSGNQTRTEYDLPQHTTTNDSARADLQYTWGAWITSGYAGWRAYTDTQQPRESILEAGVRVRRTWTKLDLDFSAGVQNRKRGDIETTNAIVHLGVVRRF